MARRGRSALCSAAFAAVCVASQLAGAPPHRGAARTWLDAPLGYLLRTDDEFGTDVALLLRIVGQLTGDARASEIAEIRRLSFSEKRIGQLGPLFAADLPVLPATSAAITAIEPPPLPPPPPARRRTAAGRRAYAATCVDPAAACELEPTCVEWATDPALANLELTHQAVWLLFVRWRGCTPPPDLDLAALQTSLAGRLLGELRAENKYSEVHLERLATLGQLGYADRFEQSSIRTVLDARTPAGCWGGAIGAECHPHPTALAIWVLAHAERAGRLP